MILSPVDRISYDFLPFTDQCKGTPYEERIEKPCLKYNYLVSKWGVYRPFIHDSRHISAHLCCVWDGSKTHLLSSPHPCPESRSRHGGIQTPRKACKPSTTVNGFTYPFETIVNSHPRHHGVTGHTPFGRGPGVLITHMTICKYLYFLRKHPFVGQRIVLTR